MSHAYLFGDIIEDVNFTKAVSYRMMNHFKTEGTCKRSAAVADIYYARQKGSAARTMVVDFFYRHGRSQWFTGQDWEGYPAEFLRDLVVKKMGEKESEEAYNCSQEDGLKETVEEGESGKKRMAEVLGTDDLQSR